MTRPETGAAPPLVDAPERRRALEDLDTTFLVEAAAGSGKTTLLLGRIVNLVRSGRARLAEIAAVTFTEKAAADLRIRLRGELARAGLHEALRELEIARIGTIHAFAAGLLRERPVEAGVDPGFTVADPLTARLLLDRAWTSWLPEALSEPGAAEAVREAIERGLGLERLRDLAFALVDARDRLEGLPEPASFAEPVATLNADAARDDRPAGGPRARRREGPGGPRGAGGRGAGAVGAADRGPAGGRSGTRAARAGAAAGQARAARQQGEVARQGRAGGMPRRPDRAPGTGGGRARGRPPQPGRWPARWAAGFVDAYDRREGARRAPRLPRPAPPARGTSSAIGRTCDRTSSAGSAISWSTSSRTPTRSSSRWSCCLGGGRAAGQPVRRRRPEAEHLPVPPGRHRDVRGGEADPRRARRGPGDPRELPELPARSWMPSTACSRASWPRRPTAPISRHTWRSSRRRGLSPARRPRSSRCPRTCRPPAAPREAAAQEAALVAALPSPRGRVGRPVPLRRRRAPVPRDDERGGLRGRAPGGGHPVPHRRRPALLRPVGGGLDDRGAGGDRGPA